MFQTSPLRCPIPSIRDILCCFLVLFLLFEGFFTLPQRQTYFLIPAKITPLWKTLDDPIRSPSGADLELWFCVASTQLPHSLSPGCYSKEQFLPNQRQRLRCHKTNYETEKSGCMVTEQVFSSQQLWVRLGLWEGGGTREWLRLEKWRTFNPETAGGNWVQIGCCLRDHRAECKRPTCPHIDSAIQ